MRKSSSTGDAKQRKKKTKVRISTTDNQRESTNIKNIKRSSSKDVGSGSGLNAALEIRKVVKVIIDGNDMTPVLMHSADTDKFGELTVALAKSHWGTVKKKLHSIIGSVVTLKPEVVDSKTFSVKTTMEDIVSHLSISLVSSEDIPIWKRTYDGEDDFPIYEPKVPPYIKIKLIETEDLVLFEKGSLTVPKNTREAKRVEEDNQIYEYLTIGKGRARRKADGEAQTSEVLVKTRHANTEKIRKTEMGTFVSNYDMYDTYAELEKSTTSFELNNRQTIEITTYKTPGGEDLMQEIVDKPNFQTAVMLTQRLLAGNIFTEKQKRFRNMYMPDPLNLKVKYNYTLDLLWTYPPLSKKDRAVSCLSWCPNNGDLLAVGYGVYKFIPISETMRGYVCVWSIKNPVNPERVYRYKIPVTTVEFSQVSTQLIAIGLYDGSIEVRDLTDASGGPVAVSLLSNPLVSGTVTQIRWLNVGSSSDVKDERLLAVTSDGRVLKYRIVNSPFLMGIQQMKVDRVVGSPEGLFVYRKEGFIEADRNPRILTLMIHPKKNDFYYVLTDEGCMLKCSSNYLDQYIDLYQVHEGSVYCMDFSPWSPKVYLTCGSDWCIRIWIEGILQSVIKLTCGVGPVHCAYWSRTHSTIIVSVVRDNVQIWDLRRSILKPVATKTLPHDNYLTIAKISNCGRSIAIGDEGGNVFLCAFEDMPFPPYFQYEELENSILKAILAYPDLTREVKSLGFFGYSHKSKPKLFNEEDDDIESVKDS